jgi:hypothetical protein
LPPGLRLVGTSTDWRIEGVPLVAGDFPVGLQMWSDGNADCVTEETPPNTRRTAERDITIRIARGLKIEQTQANVPPATVGQAYGPIQLTASGGGTQSWSAVQAPTGIGVSSTGVVSGTPTTKSGDTKLIVKVTDGSRSNQVTYNLPVRDKLELTVPPAPRTEVGRQYTLRATAAGGNEAYTREIAGLPTGLVFDVNTGAISGSPTVAGSFPVKMTLKDTEGRVATQDFLITVAPKLAFVTKKLKSGKVGKAYSATFRLKGGVGPIEWRLIRFRPGAKGVKLDKLTGTLRFTPGVARTYTIIVRATDSLKVRAEQTVTVTVK